MKYPDLQLKQEVTLPSEQELQLGAHGVHKCVELFSYWSILHEERH